MHENLALQGQLLMRVDGAWMQWLECLKMYSLTVPVCVRLSILGAIILSVIYNEKFCLIALQKIPQVTVSVSRMNSPPQFAARPFSASNVSGT